MYCNMQLYVTRIYIAARQMGHADGSATMTRVRKEYQLALFPALHHSYCHLQYE